MHNIYAKMRRYYLLSEQLGLFADMFRKDVLSTHLSNIEERVNDYRARFLAETNSNENPFEMQARLEQGILDNIIFTPECPELQEDIIV